MLDVNILFVVVFCCFVCSVSLRATMYAHVIEYGYVAI